MDTWQHITQQISDHTGSAFAPRPPSGIGGGCINQAFRLGDARQTWFVKTNSADCRAMFEAEAAGLNALADTHTIRVPHALCSGVHGDTSYIVIEFIDSGRGSSQSWRQAGRQLAAMHRTRAEEFGWQRDNTIGATPQPNRQQPDWITFWRDQRLGFQLDLAASRSHVGRLQSLGEQLRERFPVLIDHAPVPSLIHGDLWGGNITFDNDANPVIYDPATYFGDREAELAMTELFGGFSTEFYAAYNESWPLDTGYAVRKTLYNLYHVLNHLNLFGGSYAGQAERMMQTLLAEC